MPLSVRPATPEDGPFVYQLVWQHLHDELQARLWNPALVQPVLDLQVRAKSGSYAAAFPHAEHAIIMLDGEPVGRLLIDRSGEFYCLIDIIIQSGHRGAGIGTRIVLGLCMEAEIVKKTVRLNVSISNPRAAALYRRLGFRVIEDKVTDLVMERAPGAVSQVIAAP